MNHRQHLFDFLAGARPGRTPFFPDLSKWYEHQRNGWDHLDETVAPGALIPADHPMHRRSGTLPGSLAGCDHVGLHRMLDVGMPVHGYHCFFRTMIDGVTVDRRVEEDGKRIVATWHTPKGELVEVRERAHDGSFAHRKHLVEREEDLPQLLYIAGHLRYTADYAKSEALLRAVGDAGYVNHIINRSPFGKLMLEYCGLEALAGLMADAPETMAEVLCAFAEADRPLWRLAVEAPGRMVFIADNMDDQLYGARWFERHCLPYYREITDLAHRHGKLVLAHLDGRLKNLFPFIPATGLDLLDGCSPAPMNDFTPAELAAALGAGQYAYCGVPANLVASESPERCADFARGIIEAGGGRFVLNIGDIMPAGAPLATIERLREVCAG
jgi:hypothetical protein